MSILQAWVSSRYESEVTEIVGTWMEARLTQYSESRSTEDMKAEDSAIYFMTAVATKGGTQVSWERLSYLAF